MSNGDLSIGAASITTVERLSLPSASGPPTSVFETADIQRTASPADQSFRVSSISSDSRSTKSQKHKPRVIKVEQQGIYTVKTFESVNALAEWVKALRVSTPYIIRLVKIFWRLSPIRVSILVTANLLKAVMPSLKVWISKHFLDQVQRVTNGQPAQWRRMIFLVFLGAGIRITTHGLDVASYITNKKNSNGRDTAGGILETRFVRELDSILLQSYLRLDCKQLESKRVKYLFERVIHLYMIHF